MEDPKERPSYDARAASIEKPSAPLPAEPTIPESAEKDLPSLPFVEQDRPSTRGSHRSNQPPTASRKAAAILGIPVTDVSATPETSSLRPISPPAAGDTASLYAASLGSGPSDLRADYLAYLDALEDRSSTSTARPSLSELYAGLYQKPKIRLGPRPSAEGNAARAAAGARPISSLPQGLRAAPRKELHSANRPPQKQAAIDPIIRLPPPPPIPEVPQVPELIRPSSSAASVRSMPTTLASQSGKRTPEKKRLQKAMEMRKKQLAAARSREADGESGVGESPSKRRDEPVLESKVDLRPAAGNGPPQFSIPSFGAKADGKREVPQTFFDDATESPPLPQKEFETASPKHLAISPLRDGPALPAPEIPPEAPRDDATAIITTADGSPDHAREEPSPTAAPDRTQEMQQDTQSEARGLGITDQGPPQAATSSGEAKSPIPEPPSASTPTSTRRAGPSALSALDDLLALDTPEQTS
ncbi:MAG: hypothetical protein INR71_02575, partial [Terriglobus roseus]|nr:hypothetical protein [Terriglobus roseus]